MSTKADGSIIIDTRIDTDGVSDGTIEIKRQFEIAGESASKIAKDIEHAFSGVNVEKAAFGMAESFDVEGDKIKKILEDTEKSAKSKAASVAAIYRKQGFTQEEAFKKAWAQIERTSENGSKKVKKDMDGIGKKSKSVGGEVKRNLTDGLVEGFSRLKRAIVGAFAVREIVQFAKSCLDLGSDLQEVQNVVDVTFTTMNQQVDKFAKNAVTTAGLSETMAKRYAGTFGAMSKAFGFAESEAYSMATALTQLSGDVASFYNITQDEAYTKLKSVFTGETESLKDLGVVMTQAALDSYALANGYGKTTAAMTEQEKVALRYAFVMNQLSAASGDFIRTADGWANQTRLLTLQFEQLKATIGQGLINALTPVIKVINNVLAGLQRVASAFAQFTALLFGSANKVSTATSGAQEQLSGIADGYDSAAGGADKLAKSTEKAGKAAQKYLAGFDEIQKIGSEAASAGSGSGGVGGGAFAGLDLSTVAIGNNVEDNLTPQVEAMAAKAQELIAPLREIDFSPLQDSLSRLGESFSGFGSIIGDALEWSWFNILVPLAQWTIEDAAPASVDLLSSAFEFLNSGLAPVWDGLTKLWKYLKPVFEWIGNTAVAILLWLRDGFNRLAEVFRKNGAKVSKIFENIGEAFDTTWKVVEPILSDMVTVFGDTFEWIIDIAVDAIDWIIDVLLGLSEFIAGVFTGDWKRAWKGVELILKSTGEFLVNIAEWILSAFGLSFDKIKTAAVNCWNGIKEKTTSIWSGIKSTIKGAVNGIIGFINGMISGLISGINSAIQALNKLSVKIPDWVPSVGGKTFGFKINTVTAPKIPYLATGAVIPPNAPFMAVLGDQKHGTNIEAPLDTIKQALAEVIAEIGGMSGGDINITFTGELAALARVLKPYIDRENSRVGGSLVKGGTA